MREKLRAELAVTILSAECHHFTGENHCNFAYSALASFRMGMSGSAFFQRLKKSWYAALDFAESVLALHSACGERMVRYPAQSVAAWLANGQRIRVTSKKDERTEDSGPTL